MTWITDLINQMPELIYAIAPGFLMFSFFMWSASKQIQNSTVVIIISVTLSYIILEICRGIMPIFTVKSFIVICVCAACSGLLLAILFKSKWSNKIISLLGIKRTTNNSIWDDIYGRCGWISFYDERTDSIYCGQFRYQNYENGKSYVCMTGYYVMDSNKNIIEDFTSDLERSLLVNIDAVDKVIIDSKDPYTQFEYK